MSESDALKRFEDGLARVSAEYRAAFDGASDEQALRAANARFSGAEGDLTKLLKLMPSLPGERRRELGQRANALKKEVEGAFEAKLGGLARGAREAELSGPPIDVTLPGRGATPGRLHVLTRTMYDLVDVFRSLGFDVADGPEVDLHEHNFDKLGFPPDHPATDMHDSFFLSRDGEVDRRALLRTHTSTIQVREMMRRKPPMAVVSPGAVYRRDDDVTHSPMFLQIEGFLVDENVSFAHLRGVLTEFVRRMFGFDVQVRLRPSYFPFVEPGGELDMGCFICKPWLGDAARTAACRVCKGTGWLEVLGCGMIHPVVFEHVGLDPKRFTGFAFGMGVDRIAMLRYGIADIRLLYDNDVRFLTQL